MSTIENDIAKTIETPASTNNEGMKRIVSLSNLLIIRKGSKMDTETKDPDFEHINTGTDTTTKSTFNHGKGRR